MMNVVFDLGGVILKRTPASILEKLTISKDEYQVLKAFFENREKLDTGLQSLEEKFDECNFSLEIREKYKDVLVKYYELREFNNDVLDLIKKLKEDGYKVYILSDNDLEAAAYYRNHFLLQNIDGMMFSAEKGTMKCDGKLFDIFCREFNLVPQECYFIDDNIVNIEKANERGFKGILFEEKIDINGLYERLGK